MPEESKIGIGGVLGGLAALVTAIAALIAVLYKPSGELVKAPVGSYTAEVQPRKQAQEVAPIQSQPPRVVVEKTVPVPRRVAVPFAIDGYWTAHSERFSTSYWQLNLDTDENGTVSGFATLACGGYDSTNDTRAIDPTSTWDAQTKKLHILAKPNAAYIAERQAKGHRYFDQVFDLRVRDGLLEGSFSYAEVEPLEFQRGKAVCPNH